MAEDDHLEPSRPPAARGSPASSKTRGGEGVVRGQHRPLLAPRLGGRQVADGDPAFRAAPEERLCGPRTRRGRVRTAALLSFIWISSMSRGAAVASPDGLDHRTPRARGHRRRGGPARAGHGKPPGRRLARCGGVARRRDPQRPVAGMFCDTGAVPYRWLRLGGTSPPGTHGRNATQRRQPVLRPERTSCDSRSASPQAAHRRCLRGQDPPPPLAHSRRPDPPA